LRTRYTFGAAGLFKNQKFYAPIPNAIKTGPKTRREMPTAFLLG